MSLPSCHAICTQACGLRIFITQACDIHLLSTELIEGELLTPVCHSQNVIVLIPVKAQQNYFRRKYSLST